MGNMNEMPGALKIDPLLQAENLAVRHGAKIELPDDTEGESEPIKPEATSIDFEKQARAKKYADEIAGLEAELERVQMAAGKAGGMAHHFDKLISSIKSEIAAKEIEFTGEAGTDTAH